MKNNKNNGFIRNSFIYILLIIAGITAFQYYLRGTSTQSQQINYSTLVKQIDDGNIKTITYQPSGGIIEVSGEYKEAQTVKTDSNLSFLGESTSTSVTEFTSIVLPSDSTIKEITDAAKDANVEVTVKQESSSGTWITYLITYIPFIIIIVFFFMMMNNKNLL